jgi:hypothetical protein
MTKDIFIFSYINEICRSWESWSFGCATNIWLCRNWYITLPRASFSDVQQQAAGKRMVSYNTTFLFSKRRRSIYLTKRLYLFFRLAAFSLLFGNFSICFLGRHIWSF